MPASTNKAQPYEIQVHTIQQASQETAHVHRACVQVGQGAEEEREEMSEEVDKIPFTPTNGRVLVKQLPYKPSRILEVCSIDRADENEGIVVALSPHRYGRKKRKGEWHQTGETFPHEVKVGQRVFFPGSYQDADTMAFNGVKYRCLDSWEIMGIMDAPQPEGFDHPISGEKMPDAHPIHIFGA